MRGYTTREKRPRPRVPRVSPECARAPASGVRRMSGTSPDFVVRELDTNRGWVIEVARRDGKLEQLAGVCISAVHARNWIAALADRTAAQAFLQKFLDVSKASRVAAPIIPIAGPKNNAK